LKTNEREKKRVRETKRKIKERNLKTKEREKINKLLSIVHKHVYIAKGL